MSRILVTGASGLLGLNIGLQFHELHEIIGVANGHPLKECHLSCARLTWRKKVLPDG